MNPIVRVVVSGWLLMSLVGCQITATSDRPVTPNQEPSPARTGPEPVRLPADDAPHADLTEWWYYTGHLSTDDGRSFGFEQVIFQSVRGQNPVGYLAHAAVTDPQQGRFQYGARVSVARAIPSQLDMNVAGWTIQGGGGTDQLFATLDDYAFDLTVTEQKPAALHLGGYISFGPAGDSYYYSRTRNTVTGRLRIDDEWVTVTGQAWSDHQWGDFIVGSVGGWDWYSLQLDNQTELMLFSLRSPAGERGALFGTYVDPSGATLDLTPENTSVSPLSAWTSPHTGAVYPAGWHVQTAPTERLPTLDLELSPIVQDQELAFDLAYWEGAVKIVGSVGGVPAEGSGYVELTGYRS